jgi:hypothetical protein
MIQRKDGRDVSRRIAVKRALCGLGRLYLASWRGAIGELGAVKAAAAQAAPTKHQADKASSRYSIKPVKHQAGKAVPQLLQKRAVAS